MKKQVLLKEIQERVKKCRSQKYLSLLLQILQFRGEFLYHTQMDVYQNYATWNKVDEAHVSKVMEVTFHHRS